MQAEKDELEFEIPKCDKCGAPVTTGLMAAFCPARKNCEFYVEGIEEFMSEFDASLSSGRSGSGDGGDGVRGPCVKATVRCTLVTPTGERIVGENWCNNPQPVCPRLPGEDYTKCKTVCQQEGHAEQVVVRLAGDRARGAHAFLEGHTYACMECQHALFGAGVRALSIGAPA